jgi:hypothetical protein
MRLDGSMRSNRSGRRIDSIAAQSADAVADGATRRAARLGGRRLNPL